MSKSPWWENAVFYQIYPRSFFDSNGDGEGDLTGITSHLSHVSELGADALWLSPFYTSPNHDGGYDVADPRNVDPRHGTLDDAKILFNKAHDLGLKVLLDVVPNHFSDQHVWFQSALSAVKGSPERSRFHFLDGKTSTTPPNNWISLFGGPAWTQVDDGQWYLHLFDSSQPDLNWENADIKRDFEKTLRFWIDLGADGFRIDVAHGLVKEDISKNHHDPQGLSNALRLDVEMSPEVRGTLLASVPFFDRNGVHEIYREWRKIFDSYDRPIMAVAEAWVHPPERATLYVRPDELQQVFNFDLLVAPFDDKEIFDCVDRTLKLIGSVGATPTWALSNHDTPRLVSRLGEREARAMALFTYGLPGAAYIFQGQELGLPDADLLDSERQDPAFFRTKGLQKGRDGARVPLPWEGYRSPFGFTTGKPWLPIPQDWEGLTVEKQNGDSSSSMELYRELLLLRKRLNAKKSGDKPEIKSSENFTWTQRPNGSGLIAYKRGEIEVLLNTAEVELVLPRTGRMILSSEHSSSLNHDTSIPRDDLDEKITMSPFSAMWITCDPS